MKKISIYALTALFLGAGTLHLLSPEPFIRIVPPFLPHPDWVVKISGAAEILGGIGIALPVTRTLAGWGLAALLVAVFPANIYMAMMQIVPGGMQIPVTLLWARLALQPVLIWWVLAASRNK